jgi:hypothetical protein
MWFAGAQMRYLAHDNGIDTSRIELCTGMAAERTAEAMFVRAGAIFSDDGTSVINESSVKPPAGETKRH